MKLSYSEGSVFLVPLRDGGFARGVVARATPKGKVVFGYFFGPRFASPDPVSIHDLRPEDAILRLRFGDLGLVKGEWPIIGTLEGWNRSVWPMPRFVRRDPLGKLQPRLVEYSDTDPNQQVGEWLADEDPQLGPDAVSGFGAVSVKLNSLLRAD